MRKLPKQFTSFKPIPRQRHWLHYKVINFFFWEYDFGNSKILNSNNVNRKRKPTQCAVLATTLFRLDFFVFLFTTIPSEYSILTCEYTQRFTTPYCTNCAFQFFIFLFFWISWYYVRSVDQSLVHSYSEEKKIKKKNA